MKFKFVINIPTILYFFAKTKLRDNRLFIYINEYVYLDLIDCICIYIIESISNKATTFSYLLLSQTPAMSSFSPLYIILHTIGDRLFFDDMVYELQHQYSAVVCGFLSLHLLVVCDFEPRDISHTLAHRIESMRKEHWLK